MPAWGNGLFPTLEGKAWARLPRKLDPNAALKRDLRFRIPTLSRLSASGAHELITPRQAALHHPHQCPICSASLSRVASHGARS